jgi:hypothetical protein
VEESLRAQNEQMKREIGAMQARARGASAAHVALRLASSLPPAWPSAPVPSGCALSACTAAHAGRGAEAAGGVGPRACCSQVTGLTSPRARRSHRPALTRTRTCGRWR